LDLICACFCVCQSSDSSSGLDFCSLPSEVLNLVACEVLNLVACVLAQQGFLFSSARITCVGFSWSAATGLRFGLRVLNFHCPVLFCLPLVLSSF
jgi:hypothetical protein